MKIVKKLIFRKLLFFLLFGSFLYPVFSEKLDEKFTTKVDIETFWNRVREIREIKYGKDPIWEKNFVYCSNWSNNIAISKGEGYVMSKLIRYTFKCLNILDFMSKNVSEKD